VLKSQTVAEKTAKKFRDPLFSAAPCREIGTSECFFCYLRSELDGGVRIFFVALDE